MGRNNKTKTAQKAPHWLKKNFVSFEVFTEYVRSRGLKSQEYQSLSSSGLLPPGFPSNPHLVYTNWPGWKALTGVQFVKLEEFVRYFIEQGLRTSSDWLRYSAEGHRSPNYPSNPQLVYEKWPGWADIRNRSEKEGEGEYRYECLRLTGRDNFANLEEFSQYVRDHGIRKFKDWDELSSKGLRPLKYPSNPDKFYDNWPGWTKVLGDKSSRALHKSHYYTYQELKNLVREKKMRSGQEILRYAKEHRKDGSENKLIPHNIPEFYKSEWISWDDLFGRPASAA